MAFLDASIASGGYIMKQAGMSNPLAVASTVATLELELNSFGLAVEISSDMVAFNEAKKRARGFEVAPMHHHEVGVFAKERAHWVSLKDKQGKVVGLQAFRCDEIDTNLADWCVTYMIGAYMRRNELMVPSHAKPARGSISERLRGKLAYHGELWVDKAHRNRDVIEHFVRIALLLTYIKWQPDAIWALAGARIVERGHLSRSGYNSLEPGFLRWQLVSDGIDPFEYLYVVEKAAIEAMVEVWNSKEALYPRERVRTQLSPLSPHSAAKSPAQ
jgi:hypothetical protein